jgi:hypothetical protein
MSRGIAGMIAISRSSTDLGLRTHLNPESAIAGENSLVSDDIKSGSGLRQADSAFRQLSGGGSKNGVPDDGRPCQKHQVPPCRGHRGPFPPRQPSVGEEAVLVLVGGSFPSIMWQIKPHSTSLMAAQRSHRQIQTFVSVVPICLDRGRGDASPYGWQA